ncbi:tRNA uridine-5-carboxymethylaminomethyl(34) synthesis GTPase MnmE [Gellertiella hungarica]|uniref:tRNA modification GTPase MnmE n=1 Tax=Gellertiella hungarica TaxID=1572859 RepID=A0A7W6NMW7_9HYPH|nr:tRNA uridine-5-carboxymethylaminomethyl(34) synthesis GTPase MnmE [Gellertiella hungarica]MBB4066850.1 tRNA modification GTPase [Gellertiella hungarica]
MEKTIYALSSGSVPSGVAVVRVSGPATRDILKSLVGSVPPPRQAALRTIRDRNRQVIDRGLVLFFAAPASFTGADCAEFQVHGGKAVVSRLLAVLEEFPETRAAEAGEFTRMALSNGKLDLLEVEGLSDLLVAETEMQRRLALEQAQGHLTSMYDSWARRLTHARAMIEAELDFADEDDVPGSVSSTVWVDMEHLCQEIRHHLDGARVGEIIRNGLKVVLIGEPNAGKSSLLNHLAGRDVAIVTPVPGTTRDILSVDLDIGGFAVTVLDTAGMRETGDEIEQEGIRRARAAARDADVVLHLSPMDGSAQPGEIPEARRIIRVGTKADLAADAASGGHDLCISVKTGSGIEALLDHLVKDLSTMSEAFSLAIPSRIRHVSLLRETLEAIELALATPDSHLDLRAEYLRVAGVSLGRITGHVDTEGLLDIIFSSFCIGK